MRTVRYTLDLDDKTVQLLVDQLRRLPHFQVDAELRSIRAQVEQQDRQRAGQASRDEIERARRLLGLADPPAADV